MRPASTVAEQIARLVALGANPDPYQPSSLTEIQMGVLATPSDDVEPPPSTSATAIDPDGLRYEDAQARSFDGFAA